MPAPDRDRLHAGTRSSTFTQAGRLDRIDTSAVRANRNAVDIPCCSDADHFVQHVFKYLDRLATHWTAPSAASAGSNADARWAQVLDTVLGRRVRPDAQFMHFHRSLGTRPTAVRPEASWAGAKGSM